MFKVHNKDTKRLLNYVKVVSLLLTLTDFTHFSSACKWKCPPREKVGKSNPTNAQIQKKSTQNSDLNKNFIRRIYVYITRKISSRKSDEFFWKGQHFSPTNLSSVRCSFSRIGEVVKLCLDKYFSICWKPEVHES